MKVIVTNICYSYTNIPNFLVFTEFHFKKTYQQINEVVMKNIVFITGTHK